MPSVLRVWRTIRHLRLHQIVNRLSRRLWRPAPTRGMSLLPRVPSGKWIVPVGHSREWEDANTVAILGEVGRIIDPPDWNFAFTDQLRRYHLHYLDQLGATEQPMPGFAAALLERWVAENAPGRGVGWDPYPTSRRLVNAVKAALGGMRLSDTARASMCDQCRYLLPRLEFHLLANHLLANAKALVFCGAFFSGTEADIWQRRGMQLLHKELAEQVVADGGHFERSPMYHSMILEDVLDLLNLARCFANSELERIVSRYAVPMLGWLAQLLHPDGDVAFFNDTTLGVAPSYAQLAAYATRLGVGLPQAVPVQGVNLQASGFIRVQSRGWLLILDAAGPAPPYQPGHARAGTLSFELSYASERILVNSGVSTYEPDSVRAAERGTAAHNALMIDEQNSSEVWQSFRVGRRARVSGVVLNEHADYVVAAASQDGFRHLPSKPMQTRKWRVCAEGVEVIDQVEGMGLAEISVLLHVHPDCQATQEGTHTIVVVSAAGARFRLELDGEMQWTMGTYQFGCAFGVRRHAKLITGTMLRELPVTARVHVLTLPGA